MRRRSEITRLACPGFFLRLRFRGFGVVSGAMIDTLNRLRFRVVFRNTFLEALNAFGNVSHKVGDLAAAEEQYKYDDN